MVQIESCANGTEGSNALQKLGVLTQSLRPELKSVPTIIFDNVSNFFFKFINFFLIQKLIFFI